MIEAEIETGGTRAQIEAWIARALIASTSARIAIMSDDPALFVDAFFEGAARPPVAGEVSTPRASCI